LRSTSRAAGVAALAVVATLARQARADDAQAFELAKNPFDGGQYAEAHARLSALLDPGLPPCDAGPSPNGRCHLTNPELIERARALDAASLLALKRDVEADALIAAVLRANPSYQPSPAMFPQEVIDRFSTVRASIVADLRAILEQRERDEAQKRLAAQQAHDKEEAWIAELQRQASRERWIEPNSRWIALVPFGIGQFQNGDTRLGITFAVGEAALGGASLVSVAIVNSLASTNTSMHTSTDQSVDISALNAKMNAVVLVNRISFVAWGALTLAGVLQAEIAFVPEKVTYHDRPVPPRPKLVPVAAPVPRGAVFGLGGTF
jgi:hypothetical protein